MATVKAKFGEAGVMTQEEAARRLALSVRSIERRIRDGKLLAKKDGRRVVVDRQSVDEYLANLPSVSEI